MSCAKNKNFTLDSLRKCLIASKMEIHCMTFLCFIHFQTRKKLDPSVREGQRDKGRRRRSPAPEVQNAVWRWNDERLRAVAGPARPEGQLHREGRGQGAPREVPHRQVRITPDEPDSEATRRRDVAVRRTTEAVRSAGKLDARIIYWPLHSSVSHELHRNRRIIGFEIRYFIPFPCAKLRSNGRRVEKRYVSASNTIRGPSRAHNDHDTR